MATSRRMLQVITAGEQKTSWPEVVGMVGMGLSAAAAKIQGDRPDVHLEVHLVGDTPGPGFYDDKRVRIFVNLDPTLSVSQTPVIG